MSNDSEPMFEDLPIVIIQRIGNFLPCNSVVKLSLVNKHLKSELEPSVNKYRKLFLIFRKIFTRDTSIDNWAKELYDDTEMNDYIVAVKVLLLIIAHHEIDFIKAQNSQPDYFFQMKGWGEYETQGRTDEGYYNCVNVIYNRKGKKLQFQSQPKE